MRSRNLTATESMNAQRNNTEVIEEKYDLDISGVWRAT